MDASQALSALRSYATGRRADEMREHGITVSFASPREETIERIETAVAALGGVVYGKRPAGTRDGMKQRWTRIEWCTNPTTDLYIVRGSKDSGVSRKEALRAAVAWLYKTTP